MANEKSLYEVIGGAPAVEQAVDVFYRKVLADERISDFFDDVDMDRQAAKQAAFLTMALGGPNKYTGSDLRRGHAHLVAKGLNDIHFDAVIGHLNDTLEQLGVPHQERAKAIQLCESLRADVLGR